MRCGSSQANVPATLAAPPASELSPSVWPNTRSVAEGAAAMTGVALLTVSATVRLTVLVAESQPSTLE